MFAEKNALNGAIEKPVPKNNSNTAKNFPPALGGDRVDKGVIPRKRSAGFYKQSGELPPGMGAKRHFD